MVENEKLTGEKVAYSLRVASIKTGLSQGHLRNESIKGNLKLVKSGRRTLILDEELKRYLNLLPELIQN